MHRTSDVSQIVCIAGTLLKKARIGGIFAKNCDNDVSNLQRMIHQIPLNRHRMFDRACASDFKDRHGSLKYVINFIFDILGFVLILIV